MLEKSYFPATYYFYCGVLLLCFGGTVKQWNSWKTVSWIAAIMVIVAMLVPVLNAWLPAPILTAAEIEAYVRDQQAFLNSHLKIDDVADHCRHGRTYVSLAFQRRFGSFSSYVNGLRLAYYDQYVADHPNETKESAAIDSGFASYNACYRARKKNSPKKIEN